MRCALHWVTLSALFATGGCATVRQLLRLDDPAGAEPAEIPTAPLLGFDRIMQAPGEPDGRFEHVSLLVPGSPAVQPGDSAVLLDLEGPGVIRRIRITVASPDPHYLRRIALRMHWDGETEPSVHVPLGDFFGNGFERRPYAALPLGVASGGFYSYLPMPFTRRAYIVLENGTGLAIDDLQFDADVQLGAVLADPVATFHAFWSRDPRPDPDRPHLVADLAGAGWFVGTSLNAQGHDGTFSFLQGSGVLRIDGHTLNYAATAAYLNETGTRDAEALAGPFQGVVLRDEEHTRLAAYRWHLPDPISFRRSFRLVLERGRANRETADFATVAYWYQTEPHRPLPPLPGPHERRVPEVLVPPGAIHRDDIEVVGTGGGTVRLVLRIPRPDLYEVVVYPEASPDAVTPTVAIVGSSRPGRALDVSPAGVEPGDLLPGVVVETAAVLGRTLELAVAARGGGIALPAAVHFAPARAMGNEVVRGGTLARDGAVRHGLEHGTRLGLDPRARPGSGTLVPPARRQLPALAESDRTPRRLAAPLRPPRERARRGVPPDVPLVPGRAAGHAADRDRRGSAALDELAPGLGSSGVVSSPSASRCPCFSVRAGTGCS